MRVSARVSTVSGTAFGSARIGLGSNRTPGGNLNGLYVVAEMATVKVYWDNGSGSIKQVGSNHPTGIGDGGSKTVAAEYNGTTVTVTLDGATVATGPVSLTGTKVGFAIATSSTGRFRVDDFQVVDL